MMFWRLLVQLLRATRVRLALALLALAGGAAVCSALLNLQFDAERKLTQEFRTLGANVVVAPQRTSESAEPALADAVVMDRMVAARAPEVMAAAPFLYVAAQGGEGQPLIVAGTRLEEVRRMSPWWQVEGAWPAADDAQGCVVGRNVARQFRLAPGSRFTVRHGPRSAEFMVRGVVTAGGSDDNQLFAGLEAVQRLAALEGRFGLVQLSVTGTPERITQVAAELARALPGMEVRPIRQLAEAEGQLLARIRVLIFAAVALILALTALCVLATMTAVAMEHRRDVGLMKALGGEMSRVVRLFLTEAALLGLLGGLLGWGGGVLLSGWMGRSVFGTAVSVRPEVLPLTVALMTAVALAGALPLRLLAHVRPAVILRGE